MERRVGRARGEGPPPLRVRRLPAPRLAPAAAAHLSAIVAEAVARAGQATLALSGGRTAGPVLACLAAEALPWSSVRVFQVDELVAPDGDPARHLTGLQAALAGTGARIEPMPVTEADVDAAADAYAARLPPCLDAVHLGLGADGRTASLVPGDPVCEITDRLVAVTRPHAGYRRMTLTFPALARAQRIVWVVSGSDKLDALARLRRADPLIPASRVRRVGAVVLTDLPADLLPLPAR